eukprot:GDKJ01041604.1.p1 GENE.GDKJ01041604.1~~GDKJ01041604.1.p1  ORF type:complete len:363 (+),score=83.42 GDKJ01041604.1:1163-2251(+)
MKLFVFTILLLFQFQKLVDGYQMDVKYCHSDRILCFGETNFNFPNMLSRELESSTIIVTTLPSHLDRTTAFIKRDEVRKRLDNLKMKQVIIHENVFPEDLSNQLPDQSFDKVVSNFPMIDVRAIDVSRYKKIAAEASKSGFPVPEMLSLLRNIQEKDPHSRKVPVASIQTRQVRKKMMIAYFSALFRSASRILVPHGQVHVRIGHQLHLTSIFRSSAPDHKFRLVDEVKIDSLSEKQLKMLGGDLKLLTYRGLNSDEPEHENLKRPNPKNDSSFEKSEKKKNNQKTVMAWTLVFERVPDGEFEKLKSAALSTWGDQIVPPVNNENANNKQSEKREIEDEEGDQEEEKEEEEEKETVLENSPT